MGASDFVKIYLATIPVFFLIDMIWLNFVAKGFYRDELGSLLAKNINWPAGIIFYLLYIVGIIIFAVMPSIPKKDFIHAGLYGALFGFFAYSTYDLTNLSTIKNWPLNLTLVDIVWGTVLTGIVAASSAWIAISILKIH